MVTHTGFTASTPTYKPSRYNIDVPSADGASVFLYNTYSQAMLEMSQHAWHAYELLSNDGGLPNDPLIQKAYRDYYEEVLHPGSFVVPKEYDEVEHLKRGYYAAERDTRVLSLTIAPTMMCNLACDYCYAPSRKGRGVMSVEVERAIVAFVRSHLEKSRREFLSVTWIGGEPLIGLKSIVRLSEAFLGLRDEFGVKYHANIVTNGTLVTAETARILGEDCKIRRAQVTMDGFEHDERRPWKDNNRRQTQSCLSAVIEGCRLLKACVPSLGIRVNVDRTNADVGRLVEFVHFLKARGLDTRLLYLGIVHTSTDECRHYSAPLLTSQAFAEVELRWRAAMDRPRMAFSRMSIGCGSKKQSSFGIDPWGYLSKCWHHIGVKGKEIGHVTTGLFNRNPSLAFDRYNPFDHEKCRTCPVLPTCMGGCVDRALAGGAHGEDACKVTVFASREYVRQMAEKLRSADRTRCLDGEQR